MKNKQSRFSNYITIEGDGTYPQLYCPVCGREITHTGADYCPHLLFECAYSHADGEVKVNYLHERFNKVPDRLSDDLNGTDPCELPYILKLNPDNMLVLTVRNLSICRGSQKVGEIVVGIEFKFDSRNMPGAETFEGETA